MKIADVIGRVNTLLKDSLYLRWPLAELVDYYNDAVRAVILVQPQAGAKNEVIQCVPGTKQTLPEGIKQLLDVFRITNGRVIKPIPREVVDAQYPDWHDMTGTIECFIYDEAMPQLFFLFPGTDAEISLDAVVVRIPSIVTANQITESDVPINDIYINPIVDWMMFRAFSKDNESGANLQLAGYHYQIFADQLGIKQNADSFLQQVRESKYSRGTS